MTANDLLAGGYRMASQVLHTTCADLTPDEFRHQPVTGANSAAWIVGHLAITARRTAERLGVTSLPELTEEFIQKFRQTRKPAEVQSDLGNKDDLFALFDTCINKVMEAIRQLPAEALAGPVPNSFPPFASNFGEAILFGALHVTLHCGQLSTIRRSLGKPPLV